MTAQRMTLHQKFGLIVLFNHFGCIADKSQLEDNAVEAISRHCHDLQDLDLRQSFNLNDFSLYALAHGCPNLTKLNIRGYTLFSDGDLEYLTGFCRKLKILNLCGCVQAASDHALQAIGHNCCQMQLLNLGWCENVGDVGVMSLAYGCPDLRTLDLCGCVCITAIFRNLSWTLQVKVEVMLPKEGVMLLLAHFLLIWQGNPTD
ncbi:F-box protein SKP2A-like [Mercurialis annua]|uniref:F-box protein SKP2A-like n=1 Tax=Mercurialis annua TaxID=3986 RepID=UPI00215E601E|nr:F-box protein SKP2A-like [Mercurialis annua]